jgi:effector-binding domain-containing protein
VIRARKDMAETSGEVNATETPGGEAAVAVHRGPYHRLNEAHDAIKTWMAVNRGESAGHSWEIYGHPTQDPAATETTVLYLLRPVRPSPPLGEIPAVP